MILFDGHSCDPFDRRAWFEARAFTTCNARPTNPMRSWFVELTERAKKREARPLLCGLLESGLVREALAGLLDALGKRGGASTSKTAHVGEYLAGQSRWPPFPGRP